MVFYYKFAVFNDVLFVFNNKHIKCRKSIMAKQKITKRSMTKLYISQLQLKNLLEKITEKSLNAKKKGRSRDVKNELIIKLLLETGIRASELCSLKIKDTPVGHGKNVISITSDKIETRHLNISDELSRSLCRHVKLHRKKEKLNAPLFINERGNPFSYMSLYSKVKMIGQSTGIPGLCPKMFRHTYIVNLYNKEMDLRLVQQLAGHVDIQTTASYIKPDKQTCKTDAKSKKTKTVKCDSCEKIILKSKCTKIDSGQMICKGCLKYFR